MLPIQLVETERDDFDGPIVEMWRGQEFVGMVFHDGETTVVQIYPDADGDVHDLDVRELQLRLDTAIRMVDPDGLDDDLAELRQAAQDQQWDDEHPATKELLAEFDEQIVHRTEDGEGFFDRSTAEQFIRRCEELDLAVVEMDAFSFVAGTLSEKPDQSLAVTPQTMMTWSEFRSYANATASQTLSGWPRDEALAVAFVFQQPDAEMIVA